MNNSATGKAIGVFDSGVGGLTVMRALMERLPNENLIYFGDTARVPYGVKSKDTIRNFSRQIAHFLLAQDVKALVIACNTIAAVAGEEIRALCPDKPVLDVIAAGARCASTCSRNGVIGVMATSTTVNSNAYARAIASLNPRLRVVSQACPLLTPIIEEGWLEHEITRLTLREYLRPLLAENIDTLVLGCTHYPLIKPLLQEEISSVCLVDSAITTADAVAVALTEHNLRNDATSAPQYTFYVSDIPLRFQTIAERFLGRSLDHISVHSFD